jgi:hypothetical protein
MDFLWILEWLYIIMGTLMFLLLVLLFPLVREFCKPLFLNPYMLIVVASIFWPIPASIQIFGHDKTK